MSDNQTALKHLKRLSMHEEITNNLDSGVYVLLDGHKSLPNGKYQVKSIARFSGGELEGKNYFSIKVINGEETIHVGCNSIASTTTQKPYVKKKESTHHQKRLNSLKSSLYDSNIYTQAKPIKEEKTPEPIIEKPVLKQKKNFLMRLFFGK